MRDLNWNTIELVELEEDANLNFDTKVYLPSDFSAYNIDWSTVNLVELEEDIELNFNTKAYLPKAFNPYKGMDCEKGEVVCLY